MLCNNECFTTWSLFKCNMTLFLVEEQNDNIKNKNFALICVPDTLTQIQHKHTLFVFVFMYINNLIR